MKMESMAQFLIKGDIIMHNRKKYEVTEAVTKGDKTTIIYKTIKSDMFRMMTVDKSEFFKIISAVEFDGESFVK